MSLLEEYMEDCTMIDKIHVEDGYGGFINKWVPGAKFKAAIVKETSDNAKIAEAEGTKGIYTVTTTKNVNLQFHEVFQRDSDKKIFRCTTDGDDVKTPDSATLDMRQVNAEEWVLTNDEQRTSNS